MIKATLKDLELELWLINRDSSKIIWETKDKNIIPIKDMSDDHLINAINYLEKIDEMTDRYYDFCSDDIN